MASYHPISRSVLLAVTLFCIAAGLYSQSKTRVNEIGRTTEKELRVVFSSSFGSVKVARGEKEKILIAETADDQHPAFDYSYAVKNRIGYLDLTLSELKEGNNDGDWKTAGADWHLGFTDAIPVAFDVELGAGNGDFSLGGLRVKSFTLSTGASDVLLSFDSPNGTSLEHIDIESGVSKFHGRNLGNAKFKSFAFEGNLGTYTLDFGGDMPHDADVDIKIGFGTLSIFVPRRVGVRIFFEENWFSRLDCDDTYSLVGQNEYQTENFESAKGRLNIHIEAGLGNVRVRSQ